MISCDNNVSVPIFYIYIIGSMNGIYTYIYINITHEQTFLKIYEYIFEINSHSYIYFTSLQIICIMVGHKCHMKVTFTSIPSFILVFTII